jgi:nitrate/nitrite transport system ATP-binding protein
MLPFIQLDHVSKSFGRSKQTKIILNDINLHVNEGDFVTVIGFSGTGKTTLLSLLAGLLQQDKGSMLIDGKPLTAPSSERGVVFQNYSLLPWLTVDQNIQLAVDQVFPEWNSSQKNDHIAKYVKMVKLSRAAKKLPHELSGGMRQRVSVARALAMEPKVLLLDEPLSALDALTRSVLQDEISEIWQSKKTTVIWITNDPDEALFMADRVIPLLPNESGATLGAAIEVDIPRPHDRKTMLNDSYFRQKKIEIIQTLTAAKNKNVSKTLAKIVVPDILPEDLNVRRSPFFSKKLEPRRRSQLIKKEMSISTES